MSKTIIMKDSLGVVTDITVTDHPHEPKKSACEAVDRLRDWFLISGEAADVYTEEERQLYTDDCREAMIAIRCGQIPIVGQFLSIADFEFHLMEGNEAIK